MVTAQLTPALKKKTLFIEVKTQNDTPVRIVRTNSKGSPNHSKQNNTVNVSGHTNPNRESGGSLKALTMNDV